MTKPIKFALNLIKQAYLAILLLLFATQPTQSQNPYGKFKNGLPADNTFFPIAVWLQNPSRAEEYRALGINLYIGLWKGPTEQQLAALKKAGMMVICEQNDVGIQHIDDKTIVGWMHGDEPDNAQPLGNGKGYGPPIPPQKIIEDYQRIRKNDPSRPVLLNLGQGVAWDNWIGRGIRRNHPEDYPEYIKGGDIVSFDIYPATHSSPEVAGNLWYVARGVQRLIDWSKGEKIVWNCIECTQISNPNRKPTPEQVRCEVWMSLVHGSHGIIYFVHQWQPKFIEAGLLADKEMAAAVKTINSQIHDLAPVLNSPKLSENPINVEWTPQQSQIAIMSRGYKGNLYLFAVAMRAIKTKATFRILTPVTPSVEVLYENRSINIKNGAFEDDFEPYAVHLYKIKEK
ncbi:MAG: beta-galactosidase [Limisphaerales bacterium]|jgi:hypothetical protein